MIGGTQVYNIIYRLKRSHDTVCVNEQNCTEGLSSLLGHSELKIHKEFNNDLGNFHLFALMLLSSSQHMKIKAHWIKCTDSWFVRIVLSRSGFVVPPNLLECLRETVRPKQLCYCRHLLQLRYKLCILGGCSNVARFCLFEVALFFFFFFCSPSEIHFYDWKIFKVHPCLYATKQMKSDILEQYFSSQTLYPNCVWSTGRQNKFLSRGGRTGVAMAACKPQLNECTHS